MPEMRCAIRPDARGSIVRFGGALVLTFMLAALMGCAEESLEYSVRSPGGTWEARAYYINPGAAGSGSDRVDVVASSDGDAREIWSGPQLPSAPVWIDDETVLVGEQALDARAGHFDWYKDSEPEGLEDSESAVRSYVEAVVAGDLEAMQDASGPIVTREVMAQVRKQWFGQDEPDKVASLRIQRSTEPPSPPDQSTYEAALVAETPDGRAIEVSLWGVCIRENGLWTVDFLWPPGAEGSTKP